MKTRWNVDIVRDLDGIKIITHHHDLTGSERMALRIEQECLPGEIVTYETRRYSVVEEAIERTSGMVGTA